MRKIRFATLLLLAAILAIVPMASAGASPSSPGGGDALAAPNLSIDIAFDGYCDGLHIDVPATPSGIAGTADGYHTGCITGGWIGVAAGGVQVTSDYGGLMLLHIVVRGNYTWTIYGRDANGDLYMVNQGTWHVGTPSADAGVPAAASAIR